MVAAAKTMAVWFSLALSALLFGTSANADTTTAHSPCYAFATQAAVPPSGLVFSCDDEPRVQTDRTLWLRYDARSAVAADQGAELLVHQSRFERLTVRFVYADGETITQQVRRGAYGRHWRVGGHIVFDAPSRPARLTSVYVGLDGLASYKLLRVRLLPSDEAGRETSALAALVGSALALLTLGFFYNGALAAAARVSFVGWHAAWTGAVLLWGLLWSQVALFVLPEIAGTTAAMLCTGLSTLAIGFASLSVAAVVGPDQVGLRLRRLVVGLGVLTAVIGVAVNLIPAELVDAVAIALGTVVLSNLGAAALALVLAWWRGNRPARDFMLAWALPMLVLGATQLFDFGSGLLGGGAQFAVLVACAFQTLWLSIATTFRLASVRAERDAARAAQAELHELAIRDPLTGLLNRRGFVDEAQRTVRAGEPLALILLDVDHFKAINDRFGHDVGDEVLKRLVRVLARHQDAGTVPGRLGGEEFGVLVCSSTGHDLVRLAEQLRAEVAVMSLEEILGEDRQVTVSVGAVQAAVGISFETLYRAADQALYTAKREGRDRVAHVSIGGITALELGRSKAIGYGTAHA